MADQTPSLSPDVAYRLVITKKELAGSDGAVLSAVAPGPDPNTLNASFTGIVPRKLAKGLDTEDEIEIYVVLRPKAPEAPATENVAELPKPADAGTAEGETLPAAA